MLYDKNGEEHYNLISALHKSMRNSDPGRRRLLARAPCSRRARTPLYVARRLIRFASEDIGLADSRALEIALAAYQASHFLGMPECSVHLAHAVIYLSLAPRSNAVYQAYESAKKDALTMLDEPVPLVIRNAPTSLMKDLGYGRGLCVCPRHGPKRLRISTACRNRCRGRRVLPAHGGRQRAARKAAAGIAAGVEGGAARSAHREKGGKQGMKLLHLSDLHLGKRLNECSLLEDQAYILGEILRIAREEAPDAALLCGDLYDKAAPPAEAVALFDDFLVRLSALTQVFLLSGNHDSPERVAFGGRLMEKSGVHVAPVYAGHVWSPSRCATRGGEVNVYLLPFVKPAHVRRFFPETEIASWTDAVAAAVGEMHPDPAARSVLAAHLMAAGSLRCESEEIYVGRRGGRGHRRVRPIRLRGARPPARPAEGEPRNGALLRLPRSNTPSRRRGSRSPSPWWSCGKRGTRRCARCRCTRCATSWSCAAATRSSCAARSMKNTTWQQDYTRITLTDEQPIPDGARRLQTVYHGLLRLDYDNSRTRAVWQAEEAAQPEQKSPLELLGELYEKQNGQPMSEAQRAFAAALVQEVWEGEA